MRRTLWLILLAAGALMASCDRTPTLYEVEATPDPPGGGTVSPADSTVEEGRTLRLQAVPSEGYRFVRWSGDRTDSTNPLEFKVDRDYSLMAEFQLKEYELDVDTVGEGGVTQQVVAADDYRHGTVVELAAVPAEGWHFVEWTGDLQSTQDTVQVQMQGPKKITAVFEIDRFDLVVNSEGNGSVSQQVVAADSTTYDWGSLVELTAQPDEGHHFVEWSGDLEGSENPARITVKGPRQVNAHFAINTYELSLQADGPGSVSRSPDLEEYEHGTEVEIEAKPNVGYKFTEWTGDFEGTANPATVVMDGSKQIKAAFTIKTYPLTVNVTGEGEVTREPDQEQYEHGTKVKLSASADDHFEFVKWGGAQSGTANTVTLTMDGQKTVHATFQRLFVIMPLGNSLTHDPGSRERLWNLLTGDGYRVDFVGDQDRPKKNISIPDTDHEGVPGITIKGISDKIVGVLGRHNPRYVNLMVGTNDIVWGYNETAQSMADRWNELVQKILDNTPSHTYVVAATIPPATSKIVGDPSMDERDRAEHIADYNEALRSHVNQRQQDGDNIILADVYAELNVDDHLSGDGVHLNEEGFQVMGTVYYKALMFLLSL
ncbi:MAG: GDSL-type esterase/lipase family protein [Balneolaceae bacterium]|nr:GDSL-type esterase/lipase family protein [Balneolaceae bacterium]